MALIGVLEALKDPNINKIGVYGASGMGKPMLVKEVVAQAQRDKLFDKYPFVVVSRDPNWDKIQREIAGQLGLQLDVVEPVSHRCDPTSPSPRRDPTTHAVRRDGAAFGFANTTTIGISGPQDLQISWWSDLRIEA
ncbi:disease resistance protein At4g27190-like [Fagus crenata]